MTLDTHNSNSAKTTKPRRWFRFRLRTLLVMVTLLSVPLGWAGWELDQRRKEKAVVAWVEELGGQVYYRSFFPKEFFPQDDLSSWWGKTKDNWFGERVEAVVLFETQVSDLSPLTELKNLQQLTVIATEVSDLSPLVELKNLKMFNFDGTQVSDEQVQQLRLALPNCEIQIESPN